jgi:ABC-type lipoprotein release transport system permease subunit
VGFVWLRLRAELRATWRSVVVLALVLGIGGGLALTAFAGAQRSGSAMPEFVAYSLPDDGGFLFGSVSSPPASQSAAPNSLALSPAEQGAVDLPQVVAHFQAPYLFLTTDRTGHNINNLNWIGSTNAALYRRVDRPLVVAGHLPDPTRPFDIAVNELAAGQRHLHIGSHFHIYAYSAAQFQHGGLTNASEIGPEVPAGPSFTMRVTAIVRFPQDVNAILPLAAKRNVSYEAQQNAYLTPAFLPQLSAGLGIPIQKIPEINLVGVRLRHGAADWKPFAAAATALGKGRIFASAGNVYGIRTAASSAERGIHLEIVALLVFGTMAALVTLLLVGQAIARQVMREADDYASLRSLGATRHQLIGVVVAWAAVIGISGGVLAFVIAVLASPLMPFGLARQAEIHPGFNVNPAVLTSGIFFIALLIVAYATLAAWRVSRHSLVRARDGVNARPSGAVEYLARTPVPLVTSIGVRFGLVRGRGSVPVVTAMFGAIVSVAVLAAALTFGTSLQRLLNNPTQQGWNWDVLVGNPNAMTNQEAHDATLLAHNRFVGAYSAIAILAGASQGTAVIDGHVVDMLLAFDPLKGSVYPPLLEGHAPRAATEIVLASQTLQDLHRTIGQTVTVGGPEGRPRTLRIVGRMIAPSVGDLFTNNMGDGGWVYGPAVRKQLAQAPANPGNSVPPTVFTLFAVRYAPGVSPTAAFASLEHDFGRTVLRQLPSEDVLNLQSVDRLPTLFAGLVAILGVATVGNTLVASVRQRRRDLAILKTLGFVRRQVAEVVAWQATSVSLVALLVGLPVGVACGRWAWNLVTPSIGSVSPPVVSTVAIAAVVPAALLIANVIAAWPAWVAARVAPAVVMRSE